MRRCRLVVSLGKRLSVQVAFAHERKNEYGNTESLRGSYKSSESRDKSPATGSKTQDRMAPETREERLEWLKGINSRYKAPKMSDTGETINKRDEIKRVNMFGDKDITKQDQEESRWLAKRQKELAKRGEHIMAGFGLLLMLWLANAVYKSLTKKAPSHPAKTAYIGEIIEIRLAVDGKPVKPFTVGLFTQRAPYASENFSRLVSGDNERGISLQDTNFFRLHEDVIYGGGITHEDARGGAVVLPDSKSRLPPEDPELAPFKYALVSCAKGFFPNGGFTSVFGILHTDNPRSLGNTQSPDYDRAAVERARGVGRRVVTGEAHHYSRHELDPHEDGGYIFGTVLEGRDIVDALFASLQSKAPYYAPNHDVKILDCKVVATDLPGKKEIPQS